MYARGQVFDTPRNFKIFTLRVKRQEKVWPIREKTLLLQVMYVVWYKNEANEGKYRLDDAAGGTAAVGNSMYADRLLQR